MVLLLVLRKNELHGIMILEPVEASRNSFVLAITALHCLSAASTSLQKLLSIGERKNFRNASGLQLLKAVAPRRELHYIIPLIIPSNQIKNSPHQ